MGYRNVQKGDRISEYTLVEKLGQGGFGEVWKAEHAQIPGKYVAIKIPMRPESTELLNKEAVFQHQLEHPNIVRTVGLNTQNDPPYFIMEFVDGKNLRQFMVQEGILPPPYAIDIAVQALEALSYAHSRGIVHKDIKPENILVERKRITVARDHKALLHYVKITDLGLGKMPDSGVPTDMALSEDSRTTGVRVLTGTLFYSAPEQMLPNRQIDARSDIYSLGVVLYEMLTGELPLGMDLPSELNPVVTSRLDHICKKALSIDRDTRFQTAREMIDELVRAKEDFLLRLVAQGAPAAQLSSGEVKPKPPTAQVPAVKVPHPAPVGGRPTRAMRLLEWSLLGFVLLLLGISVLAYVKIRKSRDPGRAAPEVSTVLGGPLRFETAPAGATVLVDGDASFQTPCDIPLDFKPHQLLLSKDFFETRLLALEPRVVAGQRMFALIDERSKTELMLRECGRGCTLDRIELARQRGKLTIRTPGLTQVAVHLNGEPVGMTPYEDEVLAGLHTVRLTKDGHRPLEFELRIASGAPVTREYALVTDNGAPPSGVRHKVTISTVPAGAALYIEGARQSGPTPCEVDLAEGIHRLRLELSHYEVWEERITVSGPATFPYQLVKIRGRVEFQSEPAGAEVWLDGKLKGHAPIIDFVEGGSHTAEFRLEGYYKQPLPVTVSDKTQSVLVKATMQRVPPGSLSVDCDIAGIDVLVDGKAVAKTPSGLLRLEPGRHVVRVLGVEREVTLEAGIERKVALTAKDLGMALVPAGRFDYGCDAKEARPPDLLAKSIELPAYYIDLCEVTNEQYTAFLAWIKRTSDHSRCDPNEGRNKDHTPQLWGRADMKEFNEPKRPVVGVDYYDAFAYAAWAGKRLPTEEEWEKAARGPDGRRFPWGNEWRDDEKRCNWYDFKGEKDGFDDLTAPVGSFEAGKSPYGCHDMAGNVWEWTSSYRDLPRTTNRIIRGSCYLDKALPVWSRDYHPPNQRSLKTVGFRCVMDAR